MKNKTIYMHPCMENMFSQQASVTSVRHENVYEPGLMYACKCGSVCVCVCVHTSYVELSVVVNGRLTCQLAQALWGTIVHHQTQRTVLNQHLNCMEKPVIHRLHTVTHKHTQRKKGRRDFQYGSYYDKLLLNSIPDGGIKKIGNARHKTDSKQVKHFFCFVLLCLQSDQAKWKKKREICFEMFSDRKQTDYSLERCSFEMGLKCSFLTLGF